VANEQPNRFIVISYISHDLWKQRGLTARSFCLIPTFPVAKPRAAMPVGSLKRSLKSQRTNTQESCAAMPTRNLGRMPLVATVSVAAFYFAACSASTPNSSTSLRVEQIHFSSHGATLSGSLYIPAGKAPHPAVVLFHGSGPQRRDEPTAGWFAEHGVAALTYDKRGVGESTGDFRKVPFMELADDGLAAIQLLKSRRDVDAKQIGVWGLSQGGWLGPLAASRSSDITWVIAVSGPAVSPGEQMIVYYANELRRQGVPENQVAEASATRRAIWNYMATGKDYDSTKIAFDSARSKPWYSQVATQQDRLFDPIPTPADFSGPGYQHGNWFTREMNYDPVPALEALKVPTLFLFGDQDQLIPVQTSVDIIRRVQSEPGHHDFTIQVFPGLDHAMFTADGNLSPDYLQAMQSWLSSHIQLPR
jgi:uncharacterized protein